MLKEQDMDYEGYLENCSQRQIKTYCLATAVQYIQYYIKQPNIAAVQYIKYYIKWLKNATQIKKTRGKPKLVLRFAAGTSN